MKAQVYRDRVEFNKLERARVKAEKAAERERVRREKEIEKALKITKKASAIAPKRLTKNQKKG